MAKFAAHILDRFFAPGVSTFDKAEIPDMSTFDSQSTFWVTNHFLNNVLRGSLTPPANAYIFNHVRRAEAAFSEHEMARKATLDFLATAAQSPSGYARALLHWEFFLGQSWHSYALLKGFLVQALLPR